MEQEIADRIAKLRDYAEYHRYNEDLYPCIVNKYRGKHWKSYSYSDIALIEIANNNRIRLLTLTKSGNAIPYMIDPAEIEFELLDEKTEDEKFLENL